MSTCRDIDNCRTMWGIVSSCLTTVFTCTWVAIHPNIPHPNDTSFNIMLRRIEIMIMALIAPEMLILVAMKQWVVARRLARKHQGRGWTKTHGFFVLMGGFMVVNGERKSKTVKLLGPDDFLDHGSEILDDDKFPLITEDEIQDRSKRDTLSKTLILLQTTWFILQCAARAIEHLPITEIEIATLAFTALNLVTCTFWWNKPADVRYGHPIFLKSMRPTEDTADREVRQAFELLNAIPHITGPRPWTMARMVMSPFEAFAHSPLGDGGGGQVPILYLGRSRGNDLLRIGQISAVIATVFGAIHCLAWSFPFPSQEQQLLWRISAITITSSPVVGILIISLPMSEVVGALLTLFAGFAYIAGRIILLVLAFTSLRSLPPGAYETVRWTTFIPHL